MQESSGAVGGSLGAVILGMMTMDVLDVLIEDLNTLLLDESKEYGRRLTQALGECERPEPGDTYPDAVCEIVLTAMTEVTGTSVPEGLQEKFNVTPAGYARGGGLTDAARLHADSTLAWVDGYRRGLAAVERERSLQHELTRGLEKMLMKLVKLQSNAAAGQSTADSPVGHDESAADVESSAESDSAATPPAE